MKRLEGKGMKEMMGRHMGAKGINVLKSKSASGHKTSSHRRLLPVRASTIAALGRSATGIKESGVGPLAFRPPLTYQKMLLFFPTTTQQSAKKTASVKV